jgi:cytochrome c-type biogenesis protein CcmH/NrfG
MRAREALAGLLAQSGKPEEAIAHWEAMLDLNPNDNQGVRTELLRAYLERDEQEKAAALLRRYPDDASTEMAYGRALHRLARGDGKAARKALREALRINPHVPAFLLGERRLPKTVPELVTWGGEDEAGVYALDHLELWRKTKGALEMLARPARRR